MQMRNMEIILCDQCAPVHQGVQGRIKLFNTNSQGEERILLGKLVLLDVNISTQNKGQESG